MGFELITFVLVFSELDFRSDRIRHIQLGSPSKPLILFQDAVSARFNHSVALLFLLFGEVQSGCRALALDERLPRFLTLILVEAGHSIRPEATV